MKVPFTEKTYEKYVVCELSKFTNQMFSPDPWLESLLGFDDSFFLPWRIISSFAPHVRRARQMRRSLGILLSDLAHVTEAAATQLPPFKLNLFLQYKRPYHLSRSNASEWRFYNSDYFRYETTPHQQSALEKLDSHSAGRTTALYASAAFATSKRLFQLAVEGTVTEQSNFADISRLTGHERFTYFSPGSGGIACSEPTLIESSGLGVFERMNELESLPLDEQLLDVAKTIEKIVQGEPRYTRDLYGLALRSLAVDEIRSSRLMPALKSIAAFSVVFSVSYYAFG